jgi:ribosomal protein L37AE/L43A
MRHTNLYCPTCRQTTLFIEQLAFFECRSCQKKMMKTLPSIPSIETRPPLPPAHPR